MKTQSKQRTVFGMEQLSAVEIEAVHGGGKDGGYSEIEPFYERYYTHGWGGYVIYDFAMGMCYDQGSRPSLP